MVFSSLTFLFVFLPIFLLVFHLLNPKFKFYFLFLSSLLFYFWGENFRVWILLTTICLDYLLSLFISGAFTKEGLKRLESGAKRTRIQKIGLIISIISNIGFLAYFKYANFFVDNFLLFCRQAGLESLISENIIRVSLPLGISFYTFQSMSYIIDVYRGRVTANKKFINFASYVTMFPQLVAGPIVRYSDIEEQINDHNTTIDDFVSGIKRFIIGLFKKVIIANTMATVADKIFALPAGELTPILAWIGTLAYTLQIYYDFSGYSCMAIGLGKMIGFHFPENFNYPLISKSIREFWQRWHITLSTWFRDYLYIPLGGSKKGELITYRNLLIVFFICGLWHGASWNFIIWGLFLGTFMILERLPFIKSLKAPGFLQHLYTLLIINIGWAFFRPNTLPESFNFLSVMFGKNASLSTWNSVLEIMQTNVVIVLITGILFSMPAYQFFKSKYKLLSDSVKRGFDWGYLIVLFSAFILCIMSLASGTYNPFIYFRF
jgi:alginate O-acetyltransferase complex protein AlgI